MMMNQLSTTSQLLSLRGNDILKAEGNLTFENIIESGERSVIGIKKDSYDQLYDFAVSCAGQYLKLCYPNQIGIAPVIASDLIESRPDWKASSFIHCFKFLRQRQDIEGLRVMGNQITVPKLMEMISVYEDHRAAALEQFHAKKKGNLSEENKSLPAQKLLEKFTVKADENLVIRDAGMGNDFDRTQAERERTGKDVSYPNQVPDENYFRKNFNQ